MPSAPAAPAAVQRYELLVRVSPQGGAWRATLITANGARLREFDTPEALVRHLRLEASLERRRGLR